MTGGSFVASALGCSMCGNTVIGAMKHRPEAFGMYITLSALPSSQGLYGFVGYFMVKNFLIESITFLQASAILCMGLLMAIANLYSCLNQAQICANGIKEIRDGNNVFTATMILAVFPELYAILALLITILVSNAI
jgi:V/A-type H+-transporting ATPase subunit K